MITLVLFGPPGAGKGTQSEKLIQKYGFVHISTGDLFRWHTKNDTALGKRVKEIMNSGALVPDEIRQGKHRRRGHGGPTGGGGPDV